MTYFNSSFVEFFKGLAANNSKEYFDEHRKTYEKEVKKPFHKLILDLSQELSKFDPAIGQLELKNALFRINRDIRFSKDKSPYNLHVSAVVSPYGRKDMQYPGLYIQLSVDECHFGGGMYMPDKDNLMKIRKFIGENPKEFDKLLKDKAFTKVYGSLAKSESNKILPKELKQYSDSHPLIFNKQFYYMAQHPGEKTVLREDLIPFIVSHYQAAQNWDAFFKKILY